MVKPKASKASSGCEKKDAAIQKSNSGPRSANRVNGLQLLSRSVIAKSAVASDSAAASSNGHANGAAVKLPLTEAELAEKIRELVRLAQEQGHLTHSDLFEAFPGNSVSAEVLDDVLVKLRTLEVEIVDQAELDRVRQPEAEEEEHSGRLDILDDPVRMYLKQMGQVPLLTREQEVEISKRIEEAEAAVKRAIYSFGFAGKEHIALAEKLLSEPPKERFDRVVVDKKIEGREKHLLSLRRLVKQVRTIDESADAAYAEWQGTEGNGCVEKSGAEFQKLDQKLQRTFSKFFFKHKVIEEMALVAENIRDKFRLSVLLMD